MNFIVMIAALVGGILLESVVPGWRLLGQAKLPVVLSVVVYYALNRTVGLMLTAALAGGLLYDALRALPLGYTALAFSLIGILIWLGREVFFRRYWLTQMVLGAGAGAGVTLVLGGLLWLTEPRLRDLPPISLAIKAAGEGILGMILVPLVFSAMERLDRVVGNIGEDHTA